MEDADQFAALGRALQQQLLLASYGLYPDDLESPRVIDDGSVRADVWESIASLVSELIVSKSQYGDHITLRRRRKELSLAAEMRWGLLPPLTFTSLDVTIAGFLQPCDGIAGDAFDYGVTKRTASLAIFDAMSHGIEASRMANVAVGCYRNARLWLRAGRAPIEVDCQPTHRPGWVATLLPLASR